MNYSVGIDVGTSSCKTVIVDENGEIVGSATQDYETMSNAQGGAFQDPMDWYSSAISTLNKACKSAEIDPKAISVVGCSGQMQGATFLGKDGSILRNSMIWHDMTSNEETRELNKNYSEMFLKHCKFLCTTPLSISKLVWVKKNQPKIWEQLDKFTFTSSFITYKLTGRIVADISNIGFSGLNDVESNNWCWELADAAGIEHSKFPELLKCDEIIGKISAQASTETGLSEGIPVIAGCGDVSAECYGLGIAGKDQLKLRLGSASAANAVFLKSTYTGNRDRIFPHVSPDYITLGGYTRACARPVKWLRSTMFADQPQFDKTYDFMDREGSLSPLGANGVIFHPYFSGDGEPYGNADLRAKFTGITAGHTRGDFVRAVYEGVSFAIRDMLEAVPELWNLKEIVYVGGATKSPLWFNILVDILGKDGIIPKYGDASYGVALLAADSVKLFSGSDAAEHSKQTGRQVKHNHENHQKYSMIFKQYKRYALLEYNADHQ